MRKSAKLATAAVLGVMGVAACDAQLAEDDSYPCDWHVSRGDEGVTAEISCEGGDYEAGDADGVEAGRRVGLSEGIEEGRQFTVEDRRLAYSEGWDEGHRDGYDEGYVDGRSDDAHNEPEDES